MQIKESDAEIKKCPVMHGMLQAVVEQAYC